MSAMNTLKKFGLEQAFNYVYKDPDKNFIKIMDWADKIFRWWISYTESNDPRSHF
mgnify:CR=1 FL=1